MASWSKENLAALVAAYLFTYLMVDSMATKNSAVKLLAGLLGGNAVFYPVLILNRYLVRNTSIRIVLVETLKEFGWPEFFDWVPIRPVLIFLCFWLTQSESLGSAWGHGVADAVFYFLGFSNAGLKIAETSGLILARIANPSSGWRV
ncbi:MAG: hypothetical protein WC794_05520 [Candidatus Doudnabacteria bacterium]